MSRLSAGRRAAGRAGRRHHVPSHLEVGHAAPIAGRPAHAIALQGIDSFKLAVNATLHEKTTQALEALYPGAVAMLLGTGLRSKTIAGTWQGLAPEVLVQGDVPGSNDLLGEILIKRFGLTTTNLDRIFPQHTYQAIGALA